MSSSVSTIDSFNNFLSPSNKENHPLTSFNDMKSILTSPFAGGKASMEPSECLNLLNMNSLGEPDPSAISKHDLLSAITFDKRGNYLSVGDRGGRIIIFEKVKNEQGLDDFDYFTEFQAHTKSFDVLNSSDISEEITAIEWLNKAQCTKPMVMTCNARTVKLWRLEDKKTKKHESCRKLLTKGRGIVFPKTKTTNEGKEGKLLGTFKTGKEQHLHSLSQAADNENFLAADESRINLFNLERQDAKIYNLVDYERRHSSFADERITSARFNQSHGSVFMYTTSTGKINVCDFRENSDFHTKPSLCFDIATKTASAKTSVFSKWTNCISDARFIENTNQIVSRDYLSVKLWDMRTAGSTGSNIKPMYSA